MTIFTNESKSSYVVQSCSTGSMPLCIRNRMWKSIAEAETGGIAVIDANGAHYLVIQAQESPINQQ